MPFVAPWGKVRGRTVCGIAWDDGGNKREETSAQRCRGGSGQRASIGIGVG